MAQNPSDPQNYSERDALVAIRNIKQLLDTKILSTDGIRSPFFRPCVTQILIEMNDLLQKAAKKGKRITFYDDVQPGDGSRDITDLMNDCRNAVCHISSGKHIFDQNKFTFNVISGYQPSAIQINEHSLGCDYSDDIAVYWGGMKLYLGRHLTRAFHEVSQVFPNHF